MAVNVVTLSFYSVIGEDATRRYARRYIGMAPNKIGKNVNNDVDITPLKNSPCNKLSIEPCQGTLRFADSSWWSLEGRGQGRLLYQKKGRVFFPLEFKPLPERTTLNSCVSDQGRIPDSTY